MIWFVLLVICSVFVSTSCQTQNVICEYAYKIYKSCEVVNLKFIDGELNFFTNTKSYSDSVTDILFLQSILYKVPSGIFSAYKNINELSMSYCEIEQIEANAFENAINLKTLRLGFNKLSHLDISTFNGAENLEMLILDSNNIEELPSGIFSKLTKLKTLFLYGNKLRIISPNLFSQNTEIEFLDLSANKITGDVESVIQNLNKLEKLKIARNKLTNLDNYPESVTELDIHGNQLTKLFINKNVMFLNAMDNKISVISAAPDSKNVYSLSLRGNNLWNNEAWNTLRTNDSNLQKQILFLAENSLFIYLCNLSKNLMTECRKRVMDKEFNFTDGNIYWENKRCVDEFSRIVVN